MMKKREEVVLVDERDAPVGTMEKLEAHQRGLLHRAFSIFVFDEAGRLMLQRRAASKYHSGGLWTNTCCSHPRPGEALLEAAHRRLKEEMGFDCPLKEVGVLVYRAELDHGLIEHEYDHLLIGHFEGDPVLNPEEADDSRRVSLGELSEDIRKHPERYTYWLRHCLDTIRQRVEGLSTAAAGGERS